MQEIQSALGIEKADWIVSQQLYPLASLEEMNEQLLHELKNGLLAVQFSAYPAVDARALPIKHSSDINTLLNNVSLDSVPLHIYAGASATVFINLLIDSDIQTENLQGIIGHWC